MVLCILLVVQRGGFVYITGGAKGRFCGLLAGVSGWQYHPDVT